MILYYIILCYVIIYYVDTISYHIILFYFISFYFIVFISYICHICIYCSCTMGINLRNPVQLIDTECFFKEDWEITGKKNLETKPTDLGALPIMIQWRSLIAYTYIMWYHVSISTVSTQLGSWKWPIGHNWHQPRPPNAAELLVHLRLAYTAFIPRFSQGRQLPLGSLALRPEEGRLHWAQRDLRTWQRSWKTPHSRYMCKKQHIWVAEPWIPL